MSDQDEASLDERLWTRLDPTGSFREMSHAARVLTGNPLARGLARALGTGTAFEALGRAATDAISHIEIVRRVVEAFSFWGWAPSGLVPTSPYAEALAALDAGTAQPEVEQILVGGWRDSMLQYLPHRIRAMGAADSAVNDLFRVRADFIARAWEDHQAGRYYSSVLVLGTQIEGMSFDLVDRPFFSKRNGVEPVDESTLAGLSEGLPVARDWFTANVPQTTVVPDSSRHGIMHGRSLAYDTELISTKYFILLAAVWEWGKPIADHAAEERRAAKFAANAGSDATDEYGRRIDNREFAETRDALRQIFFAQLGWLNQGSFRADIVQLLGNGSWGFKALGKDHGVRFVIENDFSTWYAWRQTTTGWVLGIAGSIDRREWLWDAGHEPMAGPPSEGWANSLRTTPPNWS